MNNNKIMADLLKQLELIYHWFQGTFDNNCQYQLEKELQIRDGPEPVHDWVWTKFFTVDTPKFGDHVLLARQGFRTTGHVYRQRLCKFQINVEEGCVMNQIYKLKDESWFEKAEANPSLLAHLDPETDAECLEGCGVYWKFSPEENRFHGTTKEGKCRFNSKFFPGKTIIASSDTYLSPGELWTQDRGVDTDGNEMYGFKSDEHHKFLRCDEFKGSATISNECEQEVSIHNQGGEVKLDGNEYTLKLEQAIEVETRAKVLRLSVYAEGQEEPIGMVVSNWSADIIGGEFGKIKMHLEKN